MSIEQPIVGILLAAGAGTRFGGGKLVHPLEDGISIAAHAARNLIESGLEVIAVVRSGDFPLAAILEDEGCRVSHCAEAQHGMGHTFAHGVSQSRDARGWVIALADMPGIRPATIRRVAEAIESGATIAAPTYNGSRGHPVGFAASLRSELLALSGDSGARAVLERHRNEIEFIECDDAGVLLDIDSRSDLKRAPAR